MQRAASQHELTGGFGPSLTNPVDSKAGPLAKLLFLSLASMIAISVLSLINLYSLRQAGWWRNHTRQLIEQVDSVEQSLSTAAAWYQAYRFTKDPGDLWRSDRELMVAQKKLATLSASTADEPSEQALANELGTRLKNWSQEAAVLSDTDRPFVDGVSILAKMRSEEQRLLRPRTEHMELVRSATVYMNVGMLLFSIASLVFLWRKWNAENAWMAVVLTRLYAAEARFIAFMDHSPLLAFITDENSRLVYSNKAWNGSMGAPLQGSEKASNTVPDQFKEHDQEILANGKTLEFLERIPGRGKKASDWLVVKFPFSPDGQSTLLGGLALDVTEFRRTQRALEESEERLRLALESGAMHVWELRVPANGNISNVRDYLLIDEGIP